MARCVHGASGRVEGGVRALQRCIVCAVAETSSRDGRARLSPARALAILALFGAAYLGYRAFWFLLDDAYIAFRYVSNSFHGYGYVWNAPPFAPVEGYTSFLWVALLDGVWRLTGVEPPDAANPISFTFALGTLVLTAKIWSRVRIPERWESRRFWLGVIVLVGVLSNRTFLAWMSSGLETAMFNFWLLAWLTIALTPEEQRGPRWMMWLSGSAALTTLTRPDGLLFIAATIAIAVVETWQSPSRRTEAKRFALQLSPLAVVFVHLIWRHATYGRWLPNTFYAKVLGPWPEAGMAYLASFALEYGVWAVLLVAAYAVLRARREKRLGAPELRRWLSPHAQTLGIAAVLAHAGYYTLLVGGDHFEYRVYSQLIGLLWIVTLWLVLWTFASARSTAAVLAGLLGISLIVQWTHWLATKDLTTRKETWSLKPKLAPRSPLLVRPLFAAHDHLQHWMIRRYIGVRHQEHAVYRIHQEAVFPPRSFDIRWEDRVTYKGWAVGVIGWIWPEVYVIDIHGLNDEIVADAGVTREMERRLMAHELKAPDGYVECFRPNLEVEDRRSVVEVRTPELTESDMVSCLDEFRTFARNRLAERK